MPNTTHATVFNPVGLFFAYLMRNGGLQGAAPGQYFTMRDWLRGIWALQEIKRLPRHRGMLRISGRKFLEETSNVETCMILPCKVVMLIKLGSWASWSLRFRATSSAVPQGVTYKISQFQT